MCRLFSKSLTIYHCRHNNNNYCWIYDRLCGIVVGVPGHIHRSRVRFPALPGFLRSRWSRTGSAQPREYNWGATWMEKWRLRVYKIEINGREDPLRWPRGTLCPQNLALTSLTCGGRSVGIVRLRTKGTEFRLLVNIINRGLKLSV
jgi:hypothetical protein